MGLKSRVSIVIPCYNQGGLLAEAIDSVLGQTYPYIEVIVVDDGSSDQTSKVANRYGGQIRYLHKRNAGVGAARNTGILASSGEFLLFLDADDYLEPQMVQYLVETAEKTPTGTVFHGSWRDVDPNGQLIRCHTPRPLDTDAFHRLLSGFSPAVHCLMIRRTALANTGLFETSPAYYAHEDWDLLLRLAASGAEFVAVPEAVAIYRRYPGSMSTHRMRTSLTALAVLRKTTFYHAGCESCRRVIPGLIRDFQAAYFTMLKWELLAQLRQGEIGLALNHGVRQIKKHPFLVRALLRASYRRVRAWMR